VAHEVFQLPALVVLERLTVGPYAALQAFCEDLHLLGYRHLYSSNVVHRRAEHRLAGEAVTMISRSGQASR